jgi:hypothetical protein
LLAQQGQRILGCRQRVGSGIRTPGSTLAQEFQASLCRFNGCSCFLQLRIPVRFQNIAHFLFQWVNLHTGFPVVQECTSTYDDVYQYDEKHRDLH